MPCEATITAVMRHFAGITDGGRNLMRLVYFFGLNVHHSTVVHHLFVGKCRMRLV